MDILCVVLIEGDELKVARLIRRDTPVGEAFPELGDTDTVEMVGGSSALWKSTSGEDRYLPVMCYRKGE